MIPIFWSGDNGEVITARVIKENIEEKGSKVWKDEVKSLL